MRSTQATAVVGRGRAALAVSGRGKRLRRLLLLRQHDPADRYTRVVLSTCHVNHDPQNNAPGHLADFCQRCHQLNEARNTNPTGP